MKTLAELLREGDPLTRDAGLTEAEASALRRRVTTEARDRKTTMPVWRSTLAIAAAVGVTLGVGIATARRAALPDGVSAGPSADPGPPPERRQLQFATPGGTRIIWTFDPDFSLKGMNP